MEVLVQDQGRVAPERGRGIAQQNAIAPRGGARAEVQARVEGVLDDAHVVDRLAEDFLQGCAERLGRPRYAHRRRFDSISTPSKPSNSMPSDPGSGTLKRRPSIASLPKSIEKLPIGTALAKKKAVSKMREQPAGRIENRRDGLVVEAWRPEEVRASKNSVPDLGHHGTLP